MAAALKLAPQFTGVPCVTPLKTVESFGLRNVSSVLDTQPAHTPDAALAATDALSSTSTVEHHVRSAIRNLVPSSDTVRSAVVTAFSHIADSEALHHFAIFPDTDVSSALKHPKAVLKSDMLDVEMSDSKSSSSSSSSSSTSLDSARAQSLPSAAEWQVTSQSLVTWASLLGFVCDPHASLAKDDTWLASWRKHLSAHVDHFSRAPKACSSGANQQDESVQIF